MIHNFFLQITRSSIEAMMQQQARVAEGELLRRQLIDEQAMLRAEAETLATDQQRRLNEQARSRDIMEREQQVQRILQQAEEDRERAEEDLRQREIQIQQDAERRLHGNEAKLSAQIAEMRRQTVTSHQPFLVPPWFILIKSLCTIIYSFPRTR